MARGEKMGELLFEVSIPGRVGIKKNGRRHIGKGRNIPSSRYMKWEEQAKPYVMKAFLKFRQNLPIDGYCRAEFEFHFKNHQHECDTSNCIEGPQDLLQKLRVIGNDKSISKLTAVKLFGDSEKVIVRLYTIEV